MRILHIVPTYFPYHSGGSATSALELSNIFPDSKKLIFSEGKRDLKKEKRLKIDKNHIILFRDRYSLSTYFKLFKEIDNYEILQTSSLFFPHTFFTILFSYFKKKKVIISTRGELFDNAMSRFTVPKLIVIKIVKFFNKYLYFHATSSKEYSLIEGFNLSRHKPFIIPNFIGNINKISSVKKNQILFVNF